MNKLSPIILSIFTIGMFLISPGGFFIISAVLLVWSRFKNKVGSDKFILNLFMAAFISRILVLLATSIILISSGKLLLYPNYPGWTPNLIGDAAYYTLRGYWMALDWGGFMLPERILRSAYNPAYGWNAYSYIIALFHYIFGFSPVSCVFLNCLFGSLNGVVSYYIAKAYLSDKASKCIAVLVSFFPSLFLWSITNLKDTLMIFIILITLLFFIRFIEKNEKGVFLFFIRIFFFLFILSLLRKGFGLFMFVSLLFSYFLVTRRFSAFLKISIAAACIFLLALTGKPNIAKLDYNVHKMMYRLLSIHQATVPIKGSSYKIMEDKYYLHNPDYDPRFSSEYEYYLYPAYKLSYVEYFRIYLKAMNHFLFEPFIWGADTGLKLLSIPQMIIWYLLLPFSLLGIIYTLRYLPREYTVLFVYFIFISFIIAMSQGNVGTLFRLRDLITPIVLFWGGIGIAKSLGWQVAGD